MAGIQAAGIGSGLDIQSLVGQLVAAEGAPAANRLDLAETGVRAKLSAFGTLRGGLSVLQSAIANLKSSGAFSKRIASSSDTAVFTASATSSAAPGTYSVQVENLASAHKLNSIEFLNSSANVGHGTLSISSGSNSFDVVIADGSHSLSNIRDAINNSTQNTSVTASIINTETGSRLILSARNTGAANAIEVTATGGDGGLDQLVYQPGVTTNLVPLQAALNANVLIEGFNVSSASNTVSDALTGITINLKAHAPGVQKSLTVSNDSDGIRKAVESFITGYNVVMASISTVSRYDSATRKASALTGDALPRGMARDLRNAISESLSGGSFSALAQIGISSNLDGSLKLDASKLDTALNSDYNGVAQLFSATGGMAQKLESLVSNATSSTGSIGAREEGLRQQLTTIEKGRVALDARMNAVEARYRAQFSAMDTLVAQLRSTGDFLTRQLAQSSQ